jgi:imidazolonepropionase-like amidohydrolase
MGTTGRTAYIGATILDGTKGMEPKEGMVLVTSGSSIEAIVPEAEKSAYAGCEVRNLKGLFLMPGLINMHVHLAGNGKPQKKQRDNAALVNKIMSNGLTRAMAYRLVRQYAQIELMSGVTTIRTVGGLGDFDTRCRDEITSGKVLGPRILAANEGISVPGGHMAGSVAIAAGSIDEALAQVEHCREQRCDLIKLMITGGVLDGTRKGEAGLLRMDPAMIKAACNRAHELGYKVAAHVEGVEGLRAALENGVDSIEHGAKPDATIMELFQTTGASLCTTLSPALPYALFGRSISHTSEIEQYNGNIVFEGIIACSKAALEAGVPVALGNDVGCPWITQYDFWRELVYFCRYVGVTPAFSLYSATLGNAQIAGIDDVTGSLEPGKHADMIVTDANPLDDLTTLRNVRHVVRDGVFIAEPHVKRKPEVDRELDKFL